MKLLNDELAYDGRYIQVIRRHFQGESGEPGVWEVVKRKTHGRIVAMAALTAENELILIKIFRIPLAKYVLELPAGLMDVPEESEADLAQRELLEETGYAVDNCRLLIAGAFNAGLVADEMAIYTGNNARIISEPKLENAEDIEVIKIPLSRLAEYLTAQKIKIDLKVASVLPLLHKQ